MSDLRPPTVPMSRLVRQRSRPLAPTLLAWLAGLLACSKRSPPAADGAATRMCGEYYSDNGNLRVNLVLSRDMRFSKTVAVWCMNAGWQSDTSLGTWVATPDAVHLRLDSSEESLVLPIQSVGEASALIFGLSGNPIVLRPFPR